MIFKACSFEQVRVCAHVCVYLSRGEKERECERMCEGERGRERERSGKSSDDKPTFTRGQFDKITDPL